MLPKFRAWHKQFKLMKRVRKLDLDYGRVFVAIDSSKRQKTDLNRTPWNFNNITIMQWTGLKDVNGKDIYIGDIVKLNGEPTNDYLLELLASTGKMGFYFAWIDGKRPLKRQEDWDYEFLKVGNIYQNPELLEKV